VLQKPTTFLSNSRAEVSKVYAPAPQFINPSFEDSTISPWLEFLDLGYPTTPFIHDGDRVIHENTDSSTVLLQEGFPAGYYRVGVNASGDDTPIVFYQRKSKRLLIELDRHVFNDSALVAYEFFLIDSVSTIGFQAHGSAVVYDVQVYQHISL
jgi:hypothetical protein